MTGLVTDASEVPVSAPPVPAAEFEEWCYDRAHAIAEAVGHGGATIDPIGFHIEGDFPDTHVIITFNPQAEPEILAALALALFTRDGHPGPAPGQFYDIHIHEKLNTGGLDELRSQTPDSSGLVWLIRRDQATGIDRVAGH